MKIQFIVLKGGLGNQMSQYAFFLNKKRENPAFNNYILDMTTHEHNGFELEKVFSISRESFIDNKFLKLFYKVFSYNKFHRLNHIPRVIFSFFGINFIREKNYIYSEKYLQADKGISFYYGGWHSYKYIKNSNYSIRDKYIFPKFDEKDTYNANLLSKIISCNSVSIHVRRGDYLNKDNIKNYGNICTSVYYMEAIDIIKSKVENPTFFIFSDDHEWIKKNIQVENATIVLANPQNSSWKDMCLMSNCKHNIIANSSFSWWGAWLNSFPQKIIICPSKYTHDESNGNDIFPQEWIKIST